MPSPNQPRRSMTGYAQARAEAGGVGMRLRLKSVNHRFLDLQLRLAAGYEGLGPELEKRLRGRLRRGHVDLWLESEASGAGGVDRGLDRGRARAYAQAAAELEAELESLERAGLRTGVNALELLRLPGVFTPGSGAPEEAQMARAALLALDAALEMLDQARRSEGEALAQEMEKRTRGMQALVAALGGEQAEIAAAQAERLRRRLRELTGEGLAEERLAQEAAVLAERADVSEELTRLEVHLGRMLELLAAGGEMGKPVEFLLQELLREANTLLAKTSGASPAELRRTELGLQLKAELEKMREQAQNIE